MSNKILGIKGKKVLLFYPPGQMYQRGEDRSQGNISDSAATVMRAPNDMGYASAILKQMGCIVKFIDFQTEKKTRDDLFSIFKEYIPDVLQKKELIYISRNCCTSTDKNRDRKIKILLKMMNLIIIK